MLSARKIVIWLVTAGLITGGLFVGWLLLADRDEPEKALVAAVDVPPPPPSAPESQPSSRSIHRRAHTAAVAAEAAARGPAASTTPEPVVGTVRLRIIDDTSSAPILGAVVVVRDGSGAVNTDGSSGPDGVVVVEPVVAGPGAILRAVATGYGPVIMDGLTIPPNDTLELGDVPLARGVGLRGTVRSEAGKAVANAQVALYHTSSMRDAAQFDLVAMFDEIFEPDRPIDAVATDETGGFWFPAVPPGDFTTEARAAGFQVTYSAPFCVGKDAGPPPLEIVMPLGTLLRGIVKDETGALIAGASVVMLDPPRGIPFNLRTQKTTTAADGTFQFDSAPTEKCQVHVRSLGYAPLANTEALAGPEPIEFILKRGGEIRGRVFDVATSKGIAGVRVAAGAGGRFNGFVVASSGDDGQYVLSGVPAAPKVQIVAQKSGYALFPPLGEDKNAFGTVALEVEGLLPGGSAVKDLPMAGGGSVSGRVIDGDTNTPIANADVFLLRGGPTRGIGQMQAPATRTGPDGRFLFAPAAAGALRVYATAQGYVLAQGDRKRTFEPTPDDLALTPRLEPEGARRDVEVRLVRGVMLDVEVVDAVGHGIGDVELRWSDESAPFELTLLSESYRRPASPTDSDGHAFLEGVPRSKKIRIDATHPSFTAGGAAQVSTEDGLPQRVRIVVSRGATISGRVVKPDGRGAAGIPVRYVVQGQAPVLRRVIAGTRHEILRVVSDADGWFFMEGVPAGDGRLELATSDPEGASEAVSDPRLVAGKWLLDAPGVHLPLFEGREERVTLYLVPSLTIEGVVQSTNRRAVANAAVHLRGNGAQAPVRRDLKTDGNGNYRFGGLRPGRYRLSADLTIPPPPNQKNARARTLRASRPEVEAGSFAVDLTLR